MATSSSAATIRHEVEREGRPLLQLVGAATEELSTATDINAVTGWTSSVAHRPSFAHCEIKLASADQKVIATAGSMLWMDGKMHMDTWCHNGLLAGWCRTCARESCCLNTFSGPGHVTFGFDLPGDILPFGVSEKEGWIMTSGSFICGTQNLDISAKFIGCLAGLCGGEGWFLTHVRTFAGKGVFYAGNYGQIQRHEVLPGKVFVVNSGLFFGASDKVEVEVGLPGGCSSLLCSGEGAVMKFRGPCVIYTQNRNPSDLISLLNPGSPIEDGLEVVGKVLEVALEAASKQ